MKAEIVSQNGNSVRKFRQVAGVLVVCFLIVMMSFDVGHAQGKKLISIGTGGTGGIYYPYGGAIASVISKYIPGVDATAEVTAAAGDNCILLATEKVHMGFAGADILWDAYNGKLKGYAQKAPLRTLVVLYPQVTSLITLDGSSIKTVKDLAGKRISIGAPNSGTEFKATRILKSYGIDPDKDIKKERLSFVESAGGLKDRKLDAIFVDGGVPLGSVLDLAATPGIKIRFIDHGEICKKMNETYGPIYFDYKIAKGTYPGITYESSGVGNANMLVCNENFEEDLAYKITKALFDHKPDLVRVHKEADKLKLESAVIGSPVPFHKGSAKYFRENKLNVKVE